MADIKTPTIHGKMTVKVLDTSTDANYLVIDETKLTIISTFAEPI